MRESQCEKTMKSKNKLEKKSEIKTPGIINTVPAVQESSIESFPAKTIDIKKLQKEMIHGIYVLESSLYGQAEKEQDRLATLRNYITKLEGKILADDSFEMSDPEMRVEVYKQVSKNLQCSMEFMMNLHKTTAEGLTTLAAIDDMNKKNEELRNIPEVKDSEGLKKISSLIKDIIQKKVTKDEKSR